MTEAVTDFNYCLICIKSYGRAITIEDLTNRQARRLIRERNLDKVSIDEYPQQYGCIYSDGKSTPREHVEEVLRQGLVKLGFSEHSPLPFDNTFSVKSERMPEYVAEIAALKEEFKDKIEILCGLEADYIPGVSETFA